MAIALRGVSAALGTGTTSVVVAQPSGTATNDVMLACIVDAYTTGAIAFSAAPAGWIPLVNAGSGPTGRIQVFGAIVGLGGLTGTSWTWTGLTTTSCGAIIGYSGVDNAFPFDAASTARRNVSGTTGTTAVTTQTANAQVVAFFSSMANGATWSLEAVASGPTLVEQFDAANGASQSIAIADGSKAVAGTTGVSSATMSVNAVNGAALVALRADAQVALKTFKTNIYVVLESVNVNPPVWNFSTMPNGIINNAYSVTWNLAPAAPPTTYSVVSGSLPTGLSLSSVSADIGSITGTPTVLGASSFTLRATNAYGTADQAFTITISTAVGAGGAWTWVA